MEKVVIIGQGYVGLPLAQAACQSDWQVTGFDINEDTVASLNQTLIPIALSCCKHIRNMGFGAIAEQAKIVFDIEV